MINNQFFMIEFAFLKAGDIEIISEHRTIAVRTSAILRCSSTFSNMFPPDTSKQLENRAAKRKWKNNRYRTKKR